MCPCDDVCWMYVGGRIKRFCGRLNIHFIRESAAVRQAGGFVSFMQALFAEANAVARAHVLTLGGNGLLGYVTEGSQHSRHRHTRTAHAPLCLLPSPCQVPPDATGHRSQWRKCRVPHPVRVG